VRAPFVPGGVSRSSDPSNGAPPLRRCRPRARRKNQPLTLPVAHPSKPKPRSIHQDRCRLPFVKRRGFRDPKRLPSTSARSASAFAKTSSASPPPWAGLCRPTSASQRSFALRYKEEGLDSAASTGSSPAGARATRRSSTSAIETFHKHDHGSMKPLFAREPTQLSPSRAASKKVRRSFRNREAELSRVRGRFFDVRLAPSPSGTSWCACARRELHPNPIVSDTSCREHTTLPAGGAGSAL
jgi:hypothetical protein